MRARNMASIGKALLVFMFFVSGTAFNDEFSHTPIGIDLGTTYSSVAIYRKDNVEDIRYDQGNRVYNYDNIEIIRNDHGNLVTPSWVSFTDTGECLVGEAAKDISHLNPERTVFDVRRLIGRKFRDPGFQKEMNMLPYKVIDKDRKPHVEVKTRVGEVVVYSFEEICAKILQKMKETAEAYLGHEIKDAVITVPATYSHRQIEAVRHAGTIAGLRVARILNEAIAAAFAYGLDKANDKNILVLDLGGGTFDASVLYVEGEVFEVLATSCNTSLGGENFDRRVVDYFVQLVKKKYNKDISQEKKYLQDLLKECEKAKIALSNQTQVLVEIDLLVDGIKFPEQLTRAKFEELNTDFVQEMIMMVKRGLLEANLTMSDVHEIVFVGGSTHIPMVQQQFKGFFAGKEVITRNTDPAEAVVRGAAVQGELLNRAVCESMGVHWVGHWVPWPHCLRKGGIRPAEYRKNNDRTYTFPTLNTCNPSGLIAIM